MLLAKNTNLSTFSGLKRERVELPKQPALLKILSDGTLVPHTHKYLHAKQARLGNLPCSPFHHPSGSVSGDEDGNSW